MAPGFAQVRCKTSACGARAFNPIDPLCQTPLLLAAFGAALSFMWILGMAWIGVSGCCQPLHQDQSSLFLGIKVRVWKWFPVLQVDFDQKKSMGPALVLAVFKMNPLNTFLSKTTHGVREGQLQMKQANKSSSNVARRVLGIPSKGCADPNDRAPRVALTMPC